MIDHLTLSSAQYEKSKAFYIKALAPLGYKLLKEFGTDVAGFGVSDRMDFWLANDTSATRPVFHLAFVAETHEQVDAFYKAALEAGGRDNGAPGPRQSSSPQLLFMILMDRILRRFAVNPGN